MKEGTDSLVDQEGNDAVHACLDEVEKYDPGHEGHESVYRKSHKFSGYQKVGRYHDGNHGQSAANKGNDSALLGSIFVLVGVRQKPCALSLTKKTNEAHQYNDSFHAFLLL